MSDISGDFTKEDEKSMGMLERRIKGWTKQKKMTTRAFFCAMLGIVVDFMIINKIPKEAVYEFIDNYYEHSLAEHKNKMN
jgi:hypothetical protein